MFSISFLLFAWASQTVGFDTSWSDVHGPVVKTMLNVQGAFYHVYLLKETITNRLENPLPTIYMLIHCVEWRLGAVGPEHITSSSSMDSEMWCFVRWPKETKHNQSDNACSANTHGTHTCWSARSMPCDFETLKHWIPTVSLLGFSTLLSPLETPACVCAFGLVLYTAHAVILLKMFSVCVMFFFVCFVYLHVFPEVAVFWSSQGHCSFSKKKKDYVSKAAKHNSYMLAQNNLF